MAPLMSRVIVLKDNPHYLTKYEGKGANISIFELFNELGKIWKCNLNFSKISVSHLFINWEKLWNIHSPRPTFQNPNVEFMDELGKLSPNLTFFLENKKGNSHKREWPHFKLNLNDWDITFPKSLRIYQWIGENGMNPFSW